MSTALDAAMFTGKVWLALVATGGLAFLVAVGADALGTIARDRRRAATIDAADGAPVVSITRNRP